MPGNSKEKLNRKEKNKQKFKFCQFVYAFFYILSLPPKMWLKGTYVLTKSCWLVWPGDGQITKVSVL